MHEYLPFVLLFVAGLIIVFGIGALFSRFYRQVEQGKALIINTSRADPHVTFTGALVLPVVNRAEVMDLSVKTIQIDRRGKEGLICNDNIRADINVTFFVRVNKTSEDVLKVAQSIGCARASDPRTLVDLFQAKFSEALKTVGKHFDFEQLYTKRDEFKDAIIKVIGKDLNGFILDDAAIDYLEQTSLSELDRDNIMDAEGIRKITALTVERNVQTNDLRQKERMEMGSQNLSADEAMFRFEQRKAEAEAKKNREISVAQNRETNEAARLALEEQKRTQLLQQKTEEETAIAGEVKLRGIAIAQKNKEREVAVETDDGVTRHAWGGGQSELRLSVDQRTMRRVEIDPSHHNPTDARRLDDVRLYDHGKGDAAPRGASVMTRLLGLFHLVLSLVGP